MVLQHPELRKLAFCSFVYSIAQLSLTTYLVTYLHDTLAYGLVAAGLALSISQFAGAGGRIVWGYMADRWLGASRMLLVLTCLMAASALATAFLHRGMHPTLILAILVVYGMSGIGWNGVYLAEVARHAPEGHAGIATGGCLAITFLGVVVGPPIFGLVASSTASYRSGFAAVAAALFICIVAILRTSFHARTQLSLRSR
jgi:MFS family permease